MNNQIFAIIKAAVEELNVDLQYESLANVSEDTPLFGGDDSIDSLSLVTLVTTVEMEVNEAFDVEVSLADEKAMSMHNSPYKNVGSFLAFTLERVEEITCLES